MSQSIPLSDLESAPSASFENLGDKYAGTIKSMKEQQQTDLNGNPLTFADGSPRMLWVITITTAEGEDIALWAKGGRPKDGLATGQGESMLNAIGTAVRNAGANSVDVGGQLAVVHSGLGKATPGMSPMKLYTAQYQPPAAQPQAVPVEDLFAS